MLLKTSDDKLLLSTHSGRVFLGLDIPDISILIIYSVLVITGLTNHEFWRDELQAWFLVKNEIGDIFYALRYEGHPYLWHFILWTTQQFYDSIVTLKIWNFIFSFGTVYLILRYAPFNKLFKYLIVFNYFFIYEYSVISRNYMISLFIIFLLIINLNRENGKNQIANGLLIFLGLQTNFHAIIVITCIIIYYASKEFENGNKLFKNLRLFSNVSGSMKIYVSFYLVGMIIAYLSLKPPIDAGYATETTLTFDILKLLSLNSSLLNAFAPLGSMETWDISTIHLSDWTYLLFFLILFFITFQLISNLRIFIAFILSIVFFYTFSYMKFFGYFRHHGFMMISFLVLYWILKGASNKNNFIIKDSIARVSYVVMIFTFFLSCISGFYCLYRDIKEPFSNAKNVAQYLHQDRFADYLIIGIPDFQMTSVSGYLGKELFHLETNQFASHVIWNRDRLSELDTMALISSLNKTHENILLISDQELHKTGLTNLTEFEGSISREDYYIYEFTKSTK